MPVAGTTAPRPTAFAPAGAASSVAGLETSAERPARASDMSGVAALYSSDGIEPARRDSFFDVELGSYTDAQWKEIKTVGEGDDRITLSRVSRPASSLPLSPVQTQTIVHAPLDRVLAVFMGAERNVEWSDTNKIRAYKVVENNHKDRCIIYMRLKGSFPVSDRDYFIDSRIRVFPEQRMIESVAVDTAGPETDAVRMKRLEVRWVMKALGPNSTAITYQNLSDPGGKISLIPAPLIDRFTQDMPIEMIDGFRDQALHGTGYDEEQARVRALWPRLFAGL